MMALSNSSTKRSLFFFLKFSIFSVLLIAVAVFTGIRLGMNTETVKTAGTDEEEIIYTIVIDAGHGGRDAGASADDDGTKEKDLNLAVAKKLAALMKTANVNVIMTRDEDIELADPSSKHKKLDDLNARLAIATENKNSVFVSIHMNKFPVSKYSGLQVYYSENNAASHTLADVIQENASENLNADNNRKTKPAGDSIYLLSNLEIPAVLVECGFLSNYEEKELLKTEEYQTKLAMNIYTSILEYISEDSENE